MKVLHINKFQSGGAALCAIRINKALVEKGIESRILFGEGNSMPEGVKGAIALPDVVFWNKNIFLRAIKKFFKLFGIWLVDVEKSYYQLQKANESQLYVHQPLSSYKNITSHPLVEWADIIHLHWVSDFIDYPTFFQAIKKPIVWTLHDSWPFCGICHYFFDCEGYKKRCGCCPFLHSNDDHDLSYQIWKKKQVIYKDLDLHIVTPSRWLGDCAKQSSLMERFPVIVIPNCLDINEFRPLNEKEISPRWRNFQEKRFEKPFVLYGAMNAATDKIKGFSNLLSALGLLQERNHANDFELIVFGAAESELSMDVSIPIHYVGYVYDTHELVSLYNLASVMVVPSLTENLSCAIMESLSCGTPVVAFNIGGNGDMIEHKVNGYLAQEKDDADLAQGILWCLENNHEGDLSRAARGKVLREYCLEVVCNKYKELYNSVV